MLGRETALQPVDWADDGRPSAAGAVPVVAVPAPALPFETSMTLSPRTPDHMAGLTA